MISVDFTIDSQPIVPINTNKTVLNVETLLKKYSPVYRRSYGTALNIFQTINNHNNKHITFYFRQALSLGKIVFKSNNPLQNISDTFEIINIANKLEINLDHTNLYNRIDKEDLNYSSCEKILQIYLPRDVNKINYRLCQTFLTFYFQYDNFDQDVIINDIPEVLTNYLKCPNALDFYNFISGSENKINSNFNHRNAFRNHQIKLERTCVHLILSSIESIRLNNNTVIPITNKLDAIIYINNYVKDNFYNTMKNNKEFCDLSDHLKNNNLSKENFIILLIQFYNCIIFDYLKEDICISLDILISEEKLDFDSITLFKVIEDLRIMHTRATLIKNHWDLFVSINTFYHENKKFPHEWYLNDNLIKLENCRHFRGSNYSIRDLNCGCYDKIMMYKSFYDVCPFETKDLEMSQTMRYEFNEILGIAGKFTKSAVKARIIN